MTFDEQVAAIPQIGLEWHRETILRNSFRNAGFVQKTIREIDPTEKTAALIISAGPSLYREGMLARLVKSGFRGVCIATDGAYIQCLKAGITPDWVITLDPHPTRMVRWFGDPDFAENMNGDDYFARQDLDVAFREDAAAKNAENISLFNEHCGKSQFVVATTSPEAVVRRLSGQNAAISWFAPLVDKPEKVSLTRIMTAATGCPAMNTGGTVGTAAWVFAHQVLKSPRIAVVGMDLGYYVDTKLENTQSFHMLDGDPEMYPFDGGGHWGAAFTDPTFAWYKQNFLELLAAADARVTNCSGAGLLYGERVDCMELEQWLSML